MSSELVIYSSDYDVSKSARSNVKCSAMEIVISDDDVEKATHASYNGHVIAQLRKELGRARNRLQTCRYGRGSKVAVRSMEAIANMRKLREYEMDELAEFRDGKQDFLELLTDMNHERSDLEHILRRAFLHCSRQRTMQNCRHNVCTRTSSAMGRLKGRYLMLRDVQLEELGYTGSSNFKHMVPLRLEHLGCWIACFPFNGTVHLRMPTGTGDMTALRSFSCCSLAKVIDENCEVVALDILSPSLQPLAEVNLRIRDLDLCSALCTLALVQVNVRRKGSRERTQRTGYADVQCRHSCSYTFHWRDQYGRPTHSSKTAAHSLHSVSSSKVLFLPPDTLPYREPLVTHTTPSIVEVVRRAEAMWEERDGKDGVVTRTLHCTATHFGNYAPHVARISAQQLAEGQGSAIHPNCMLTHGERLFPALHSSEDVVAGSAEDARTGSAEDARTGSEEEALQRSDEESATSSEEELRAAHNEDAATCTDEDAATCTDERVVAWSDEQEAARSGDEEDSSGGGWGCLAACRKDEEHAAWNDGDAADGLTAARASGTKRHMDFAGISERPLKWRRQFLRGAAMTPCFVAS